MTFKTYGTSSATMQGGIRHEHFEQQCNLRAYLVICHAWRAPSRLPRVYPVSRFWLPI